MHEMNGVILSIPL